MGMCVYKLGSHGGWVHVGNVDGLRCVYSQTDTMKELLNV